MSNEKVELGVTLYHLKDKFAYGSTTGNEVSEFKYDEKQIAALFDFLRNGSFDGMFETVDIEEYQKFIELNYLSLARDTMYPEVRDRLAEEYAKKLTQLRKQKEKNSTEDKQPRSE